MIKLDDQYCEVYQAKHQGIPLLLQDGTWWPKQYVYLVQYQMVFTLTFYENYWLVQRNYLRDFKLSFDKGHVVIILLWTYKWKFAKARIFDINQRTNKLSGISNGFIFMVQGLTQLWQG
jgi:hypothetical protein